MRYQVFVGETETAMHYAGTRNSEEAAQHLAREIVAARPQAVQPYVRTEVRVHPDDVSPQMPKYAVRMRGNSSGLSWLEMYGDDCPESFEDRGEAEAWAQKLSTSGDWPEGNPGYEVVEL